MDLTTLFAGPLGGILGMLGAMGQKWLAMKAEAAAHVRKMEEIKVLSQVDLQKADILFRQTVEQKSGESFRAAIDAQAGLKPSAKWANDFLALFRPGLTLVLMTASTGLAIWYRDSRPELIEFIITSMFTMSSVACGYWFGVRNDEKQQIRAAFSGNRDAK